MAEQGFIGMESFKAKLQELYIGLSGPGLRDALYAGAEIFKMAVQSAAPIGRPYYTYQYKGRTVRVKSKRAVGQLRDNVIIYQRKRKGQFAVSAEDLSLLIGFEKKHAFYAYWMEVGRKGQAARPFMRAAYDGAWNAALEAAKATLTDRIKELV